MAFPDGRRTAYTTECRDGQARVVEWQLSTNGPLDPPSPREVVEGVLQDVATGTYATLITWRSGDGLFALRTHSDTGEPIDPAAIDLSAFAEPRSPVTGLLRPPPTAVLVPNGFAIIQSGLSGTSGELAILDEAGSAPSLIPFGPPASADARSSRILAVATANGEALIVGTECNLTCVLKPVLWSLSEDHVETLAAPRGSVYVTDPRDVQVACAREICLVAWNHRIQQTIFTRAFDRATGQIVSEIQGVPYVQYHGGFRLLSDGEDFLLINTLTNFWPRGREVQVMARRANDDFEWSEPTDASPEIQPANYVPPISVFDGSRYVMLFPGENAIREISFSREGAFLGTRSVLEGSSLGAVASNGDGYVIYSAANSAGTVSMVDRDGNVHSESIESTPEFGVTAMPSGPYAFATRNDFDEFTVLTHGSGPDLRRGSDLTDNWRTLTDLRMFADQEGFVAVFRPVFRGPPRAPADRFVVRRIDRMGSLVGDEMPLDGIAQIEAVASAGRSEMAVVYRTDLDPVAPGDQLSELRARIVTVPSVPID